MENEIEIYIDGTFCPKTQAKISVYDHGLLYGDGVFEGIRAYEGVVFKLTEHIERLYRSAHAIMLKIPISKKENTKDFFRQDLEDRTDRKGTSLVKKSVKSA